MPPLAMPIFKVSFYQTTAGGEPVRDWIKSLPAHERLAIGEDIKAVQFTVRGDQMVLLHGFIKKTQATPPQDIALALSRIDF